MKFYTKKHRKNAPTLTYTILELDNLKKILLGCFLAFFLPPSVLEAQISGTVFRDFNGNGTKDTNEPGLGGISVKAYNSAGVQVGATSTSAASTGAWSITTGTTATVRVEFQIPTNASAQDYTAENGTSYGSSVQFVAGNATGVNFGVNYPDDYWNNTTQPIPQLMIPCYVGGSITGANKDEPAIVQLGNNQNGLSVTKKVVAKVSEVGTVWGTAFQKSKDRFFLGSFLKRHSGFGPLGTGGVYMVEKVSGNYAVAGSFNLQGVTPSNGGSALDMGSVTRVTTPATADNYLANSTTNKNEPGRDLDAFAKIGKISFGDVEMDEANSQLVLVNLFNRQLITVNVSGGTSSLNGASAATLAPLTKAYNIMSLSGIPSCVAGDLRPWGLKIYKGKGYLGVVCNGNDGVNTRSIDNVKGYVLQFDPQNIAAGFTQVLTLNLKYTLAARWKPWADTWAQTGLPTGGVAIGNTHLHHQPILSDIDFDENGGMIIALLDRFGHQIGYENYLPVSGSTITDSGGGYGDILYACYNSSTGVWTMEGGSGCPPANTHNGSSEGYAAPGTLEYFNDISGDNYPDNSMGAVTKIMGTGNVVSVVVDPHPATFTSGPSYWNTGGIQWHNTSTGLNNQYAQIYNVGVDLFLFGKADGLGDIEPALNLAPIEIGNRVWNDTDKDGIQDADELGIGNVAVELCADFDNDGNCDVISSPPVSGSATNTTATGAAVACSGNVAWSSPTSANSVNGTGATAALTSTNTTTHCLQITGMGFSIPTNATIRGVTAAVTRNASIANAVIDQNIQLIVGGAATGDNKADWATRYPTTFTAATYGSSIDMWNTTLTPTQVNATNFGINIRSEWVTGSPTARIDGVVITVYYTTLGSSTTVMATTTTSSTAGNSLGTWYFNTSNVIDGDPTVSGNQPGLATGKKYLVRIGSADWTGGVGIGDLANLILTTADATPTAGLADVSDNDATLSSAIPTIAYTTGSAGQNNHTLDFGFITPPCNIVLTPSVSGCYQNGGFSKSTVNVEVAWESAPIGDSIRVTLGSQTIFIKPGAYTSLQGNGTIVSPQVVAFEIDANSASGTISAVFTNNITCTTTANYTAPAPCPPTTCSTAANQTGGTVFNDYNANGTKESVETQGLINVTVKAYDCLGTLVGTTTTDAFGKYTFSSLTAPNYPIRVEFSGLSTIYGQGTLNGTNGRTTTQFVASASCNIDLGVLDPNDYCQTNPKIIVPCFVYGDALASGSISANRDALVSFDYGTSGTHNSTNVHSVSTADSIGTLWGMAYNKYNNRFYATATLKRHAGLGPKGIGGLYTINPVTDAVTGFDLTTLGINFGTIPSNTARGLSPDPAQPSADSLAFEATGKIGIGDLDISEDGQFLYFINLFDKKLYKINITGATPNLVGSYTVPSSCSGGQSRPFGLKVYKGKVYVGSVCDGLTSQNKSDLRAYVYQFDTLATTFSPVFDFPLTYPKGAPFTFTATTRNFTGWYPWTDSFNQINTNTTPGSNQYRLIYPQPILTDIEFDIDGSMILGFGDRTGMQTGFKNYRPSGSDGNTYFAISGGDILRAVKNNAGSYILENNAKVGATTGNGVNNNQGPGFGEFYNDDYYYTSGSAGLLHSEVAFGALLLKPGSGEVVITCMDPIDVQSGGAGNTGGVRYLNNTTGKAAAGSTMGLILYNGDIDVGVFSKATGLGDLEVACALPTYLQIGNYVWYDQNKNGVQDPCEAPLSNVTVTLWKNAVQIASTTTDANGEYYFSDKNVAGITWTGTGADTTLLPSMAYQIKILKTQTKLDTTLLTTANATTNSGNDQNDSDASMVGDTAVINLTTGLAGSTNHTYDFGFYGKTCELVLTTNVSGCYDSNGNTTGGSSVATVQAIVDWANNPSGETINVTCTGATAQSINPTTSPKPAVLTFTVPANGGAVAVTATFSTTTTCTATQNVTAPTGTCLLTPCEGGNTGGSVWKDYDNDGVKDVSETQGVAGITVKAYDCNGNLAATTTTDYLGQYTFGTLSPVPSATNKYRIEFSNIPPQYKPTFNGTNGRTDVQFISAASCTVNLGLNNPVDYCQTNPRYVLPCYVNGLTTGNAASDAALVSVPYASTGLNSAYTNYDGTQGTGPAARVDALISQIGSVWGEAYHQTQKHLYFGTFLKRHVGMADGPGYIYNFDYNGTTPTYTGKFDLQGAIPNNGGAAIDLGTVCRSAACAGSGTGIAADYTLPTSKLTPNVDLDAFGKVATMSFGDLEIQPNTDYLWAVNLYQKALIRLNVSGNPTSLPSDIEQYILSSLSGYPSSTTGILRPWALKFNDGKGYLGVVADASISGLQTDLRAYVLQFDPNNIGAGFTHVLNFDPNLKKDTDPIQAPLKFQKWVNSYAVPPMNTYNISGVDYAFYPQPVLSDIEFDGAGNMYLSFLDRAGHQLGYDNYTAESQSTSFIRGLTFGELLKACNSNAIWSIEGLNSCHTGTEFFQDIMGDGNPEASEGALALMKSNNQLLNVSVDPHPQGVTGSPYYATQGTMTYNLSTGVIDNWYSVYYGNNPLFGKANGLGDVEFLCNAAPIQIGNYVWQDTNKDGVQDPCEPPLSNITISLWKGGTQIASTTTNSNGEYYFSDKNAVGVTWTGTGTDTTLLPSTAYEVRIDTSNQTAFIKLALTTANSTANNGNDQNDNDAVTTGNYKVISFTTGAAGSVNHTYDFGFYPFCDTTLVVTNATTCSGTAVDLFTLASGVKGTLTYSTNGTTWTALTSPTNVTPSVTTTYYIKDTLVSGCFDIDTLVITVNPTPTTPSVSSPIMNVCPSTTVNLTAIASTLTPSVSGGVFEWHVSNSSSSALVSNQNTVVLGDYYLFERSPAGCYSAGLKVTVAIQVCCPTKNCLPVTVTRN